MRRRLPCIPLLAALFCASPCVGQTLSSRPAFFADPALTNDPSYGELVLGHTTLRSVLRVFAVELTDSIRLPLAHAANPDTLPAGTSIGGPASAPAVHYRLDLGAERYMLYFDKNERLVAVQASRQRLPRMIRREDLVARYPTLRPNSRSGSLENLEAPLAPCISMLAYAWDRDDGLRDERHLMPGTIVQFGYRYTCPTKPAEHRASLPVEP
jgi:hypothetical protein